MGELAERCEKAAGPDREIEFAILCEVDPRALKTGILPGDPKFTASLDAAMTLVPDGYYPLLDTWFDRKSATLRHDSRRPHIEGLGDTLALALCAAALRAIAQNTGEGGL